MDLFLSDAISLDTELVSDYPQIVKLADNLFDEVSGQIKIMNRYRSKDALKLILINLYKGHLWRRAVRYSRDKTFYAAGSRYNQIWFRYDRVIPIIDALKALRYADFKDGLHFPDEDVLYQSRIWASPKLLDLFHEFEFQTITRLREKPPKEIIQLRASKKNGGRKLKYDDDHKTETMRANLDHYNRFIEGHDIEVRLPPEAEVSWQFLESRKGNILNDRVEITTFDTDNAFVLMVDNKKYYGYQIERVKFIFDHEGMSVDERNAVSKWQVSLSSNDTYFLHYMDYILSRQQDI